MCRFQGGGQGDLRGMGRRRGVGQEGKLEMCVCGGGVNDRRREGEEKGEKV